MCIYIYIYAITIPARHPNSWAYIRTYASECAAKVCDVMHVKHYMYMYDADGLPVVLDIPYIYYTCYTYTIRMLCVYIYSYTSIWIEYIYICIAYAYIHMHRSVQQRLFSVHTRITLISQPGVISTVDELRSTVAAGYWVLQPADQHRLSGSRKSQSVDGCVALSTVLQTEAHITISWLAEKHSRRWLALISTV